MGHYGACCCAILQMPFYSFESFPIMHKWLIFFTVIFLQVSAQGQSTIRGKIIDKNGTSLPDAYVYTLRGDLHTHTDALGFFELKNLNQGDTLVISYLGFETIKRIVDEDDFGKSVIILMKEANFELGQVTISNALNSVNKVTSIDLKTNPVSSSQEILRTVPGLFIGQHAGGGKAEQIFLRGFDIDHGTDIAITVDGMPVNMVSHAHGQGYADLHFLIPETIEKIDFGKGPYYSHHGNLNTAGYVDFRTKDRLDQSSAGLEVGEFNTLRVHGMFDLLGSSKQHSAYLASEYILSDGPFESPQNFRRMNIMGKYFHEMDSGDRLSFVASRFYSQWDASGQIPQRLVDDGSITRFGAVDDTEGGQTSRTNLALDHTRILGDNTFIRNRAYLSEYDFELYSNFTFFLEDPVNGDQIRQRENRSIYGINSTLFHNITGQRFDLELSYALGLRYDNINDVELSRTSNRQNTLERLAFGNIDESNIYSSVNANIGFRDWTINAGLRLDFFDMSYIDRILPQYTSRSENQFILSPKLNLLYNPNPGLQLFLKSGIGFHSNDTRVVVNREGREVLPAAYGIDLGGVFKPLPRIWINTALWYLFMKQEFVYVGDAAVVEPSGRTERKGIDLGVRYQLAEYLFLNTDLNYTQARSLDDGEGENYIPLAPLFTGVGGITFRKPSGLSGSLRYRFIGNRPANEDNSIVAEGYFITDFNASYTWKDLTIGLIVENIFDVEWNEAQFATESRLRNEFQGVDELHFTPGVPRFLRVNVRYGF